jgi:hypothetical protein
VTARRLIIVRQDHVTLYHYLRDRLADVARVQVILDRRRTASSVAGLPVEVDGSGRERRQPLGRGERERWTSFGYRLADDLSEESSPPELGSGVA